jgi:hypothetical protein
VGVAVIDDLDHARDDHQQRERVAAVAAQLARLQLVPTEPGEDQES